MKRIASFEVDHTDLLPGLYVSRTDGDVVTYDLRFVRPNVPPFLDNGAIHTIEHLFATYLRNGAAADKIIYFGPMGCRTGFYLITRGLPERDVISFVRDAAGFTAGYEGDIPGTSAAECGNYLEHDLEAARKAAAGYLKVVSGWNQRKLQYSANIDNK